MLSTTVFVKYVRPPSPQSASNQTQIISKQRKIDMLNEKSEVVVSLNGVSKKFPNGTLALDQVSLDVARGQLLCLIGLSGSGKSTLLRHINGLHKPTGGTVDVMGVRVSEVSNKELRTVRRHVGFVFQQFGLVGRVTCLENVLTGDLG